jgi:hypothetical protein
VNSRYAATIPGLSEFQQKLVSEGAEAFAREIASLPEIHGTDRVQIEVLLRNRPHQLFVKLALRGCSLCMLIWCR